MFITVYADVNIKIGKPYLKEFLLTFIDIKDSTGKLEKYDCVFIKKIFDFLQKAVVEYKNFILDLGYKNFSFKLVGDGILFLAPDKASEKKEEMIKTIGKISKSLKIKTSLDKLYNSLKKETSLDFRVVAGIGSLECAPIYINGEEVFEECIGVALSIIVKESKKVNTFEWLGYIQ